LAAKQDDPSQDASLLQRRARRRLIGAIALVLLAVIVLPLIFDQEPRPIGQDLVIQIPSQDAGKFVPRSAPPPPDLKSEAKGLPDSKGAREPGQAVDPSPDKGTSMTGSAKPAAPSAEPAAAPKPVAPRPDSAKAESAKPAPAKAEVYKADASKATAGEEARRAQAILEGGSWLVPLGAYLNSANVKTVQSKASAAGYASISEKLETAKGEQIRVRAGPFASRAEAEKAREALKAAGLPADNPIRRQ